ncbi:MAG: T9SS type A sorting domain-containing protein [Saprospiraceae bacterium]
MKKIYFFLFLLFTSTSVFSQLEGTTWKLAPTAQALAVGPNQGDFSWWSSSDADVSTRACLFDDKFVFEADGTFKNIQDGETWLEGWQGTDPEGCGTSVAPHDGSNAATWTYDEAAGTVTLTGLGAHLGLAKVHNGGELASPAEAVASITYPVVIEGTTMTVDVAFGTTGFWHFVFEQVTETEPEPTSPVAGIWKMAPIAQAIAVGPTQGDFSWWSNSAADVTTRACLFDDKFVFNEDGSFSNVQDGETWLEPWQGVDPEACGAPIAPHDGSNAATWAYDEAGGTVTLTGVGAHLGLAKVHNGGELAASADASSVASITYPVVIDGNTMTIDIEFGTTGFWHFVLQKDTGEEPEPEPETSEVTFGVDMNGYSGTFTQVYLSGSLNGWSGDGNPLADEDGDGIWTATVPLADGDYDYKFTLDNWADQEQFAGGEPCTGIFGDNGEFVNRVITVSGAGEVCFNWNACDACGTNTGGEEPMGIAGTWKLAPIAQALAVGPTQGDFSWWSNSAGDVTTRACLFDDQFVFEEDGTFKNVQDGETWLEGWQGMDPEGCGVPVAPHDGSNAATWAYDEAAGTVTLTGVGAHIGLAKVNNGGELTSPADAPASITYPVVIEGNTMTVDINYGNGFWHFVFERGATTTPEPEPETSDVTFSVDMSGYEAAFTQVYLSGSLNGWSGDGNPLADEDGDGIWSVTIPLAAGDYDYKFTIDNWADQEQFAGGESCTGIFGDNGEFVNRVITVTGDAGVCFKWNTCNTCGNEFTGLPGTTWKLAPIAQALAVGPNQGDFSWWSNSAADVTTRACLFDDKFIFNADGTFQNVQDGETWLEGWQGVASEACGAPVAPHDGSNAATWAYDAAAGTITLTGLGAHLGLAKVHNNGELGSSADAVESITYPVVFEGNRMIADINYGNGFWHFVFELEGTTSTKDVIAQEDLFSFYPNPANGQIQIQSEEVIDELTIHDITGKVLMRTAKPSSNETVDVSGLTSGLYIIQVRVGHKISVEKLSIN